MFHLRTAATAALVGAILVAAPALAAAPATKAPAKAAAKAPAKAAPKPPKKPHGFARFDKNKDNVITLAEVKADAGGVATKVARYEKRFKRWDTNKDGKVTKIEWDARTKLSPNKPKKKKAAPAKKAAPKGGPKPAATKRP